MKLLKVISVFVFISFIALGCGSSGGDNNDKDNDGIVNATDNCPDVSNVNQADSDGDGIGDACDDTDSKFTLKVEKFGDGNVVTDKSGIDCGTDCSEDYQSGRQVVLTASPESGSELRSWIGCDSISGNTCTVTVVSNKTVLPTFAVSTTRYKPTAIIFSESTMGKLLSLDGTTYYFDASANEISTLKAGDVIASSSGGGLLRRVVSITTTTDNMYAVETADAALEDVIEEGTISFTKDLTQGDLRAVGTASKGIRFQQAIDDPSSKIFSFDLNKEISQGVRVEGNVTLEFSVDFAASIKRKEFKSVLITTTSQNARLIVDDDAEFVSARIPLPPFISPPIPVTGVLAIIVEIKPFLGIRGDPNGKLNVQVEMGASTTAGVHYTKGNGWKTISNFSSNWNNDIRDVPKGASVTGYVETDFAISFSDALGFAKAGPYINAEGYLRMSTGMGNTVEWKLYGGIDCFGGASVKFLWWSVPGLPNVSI